MELVPTVYGGITFRDQVVAQWACFFDDLEVPYLYKPEVIQGVQVSMHSPDFWLASQQIWVQILPNGVVLWQAPQNLLDLYRETGRSIFLFTGFPEVNTFSCDSDVGYVREICNFGIDLIAGDYPTAGFTRPGSTLNERMQSILGMLTVDGSRETFRANTVRIANAASESISYFRGNLKSLSFGFPSRKANDSAH